MNYHRKNFHKEYIKIIFVKKYIVRMKYMLDHHYAYIFFFANNTKDKKYQYKIRDNSLFFPNLDLKNDFMKQSNFELDEQLTKTFNELINNFIKSLSIYWGL